MLDGILRNQILCDLRPHLFFLVLLPHIPSPLLHPLDFPGRHQLPTASMFFIFRHELASPNAVVALPGDLFPGAADTFHLHSLGSRRDVDDGPVFVGAVVAFTKIGALGCARVVVIGFFGYVEFVAGTVGCATAGIEARGAATARSVVFVTTAMTAVSFALSFCDDEVFVIMAAIAGSTFRNR